MPIAVTQWQDYAANHPQHTTVGNLKYLPAFHSPQLNNARDVLVCLPDSYYNQEYTDRRYPVIYMHDGQNLFDRQTGFAGNEWGVDETMQQLGREGLEAIIVGLNHSGETRAAEYSPFHNGTPNGRQYLDFVINTVKPLIDRDFRTFADRDHTGILGSSMGGLISLYACFERSDVFGFVGAMSPSLWVERGAIYAYVRHRPAPHGKIYLDCGTREMNAEGMRNALIEKGYREGQNLKYVREEGGEHSEAAWGRRLPEAMRFLLR